MSTELREGLIIGGPADGKTHKVGECLVAVIEGVKYRRVYVGESFMPKRYGTHIWVPAADYYDGWANIQRAQEKAFATPLTLPGNPHHELTESEMRSYRKDRADRENKKHKNTED